MGVNYSTFGAPMPGRNFNSSESRYGFNSQEKDDEIFGSSGTCYTAEFWQYDARLGRRWNRDPKPNPSISDYACFKNNPLWYNDVKGDTSAVFGPDGTFIKFMDDGQTSWSGMQYQSITPTYDDQGKMSVTYNGVSTFQFNDPATDVQALKNGTITRIEVMSDEQVEKQIDRSGVKENHGNGAMAYAYSESTGKMDYGLRGIQSGDLKSNTFYLRGSTAYNVGDIGNYLWGRGMAELGFPKATVEVGSHVNNMVFGRRQKTPAYDFGPGTYGSPGFFDSPADQKAINDGFYSTPKGAANDKAWEATKPKYDRKAHPNGK